MIYLGRQQTPVPDWAAIYARKAASTEHPALRAFYQAGMVAGDTPLQQVPLVALDFETTGLNPEQDGIVSIGLMSMTLERIFCAGAWYQLVKPDCPLDERSVVIHRITHSEIQAAPDLLDVLDELLAHLAGRVVVVHHQAIERQFLDAALKRRIGEGIVFPVIDTLALEARLYRVPSWHNLWRWLRGKPPVSIRLAASRTRYGLPAYRAHHALTDAQAAGELLQAQVAQRFSPDMPVRSLWC